MNKTDGKVRRNLWLPHKLNTRITDRAREMGLSPNGLILVAVNQYLDQPFGFNPRPTATPELFPKVSFPAPRIFKKLKRRKGDRAYAPPDYLPEDDGTRFPAGMRPMPWKTVEMVGEWMATVESEHQPIPQPKDIARRFKMPTIEAVVAHDAYVTEFYANQLEMVEKKGKG